MSLRTYSTPGEAPSSTPIKSVPQIARKNIGKRGRYGHVPVLQLLPKLEIVAVASRRQEAARQLAREFNIAHAFADTDELIHHSDVDLIIILPPAPQHAQYVSAAIAARKNVYCEWPLTSTLTDTEDLLRRAQESGIRHTVGLQRRMGPSARYVRDLLVQGYLGQIRSASMHVSMNYFQSRRSTDFAWTIPPENFSHILSIYGGHFMELLFHIVGPPETVSAVVTPQFPSITLIEMGETFPNQTPDQVLTIGTLAKGGVFTIQIEGGKRNNSEFQLNVTGMEGDLRIYNRLSFTNHEDNTVEGSQGNNDSLQLLLRMRF